MATPNRLKQISEERGKPMPTLMVELLNEYGSMEKVAVDLGVSFKTVYLYCQKHGIRQVKTYLMVDA